MQYIRRAVILPFGLQGYRLKRVNLHKSLLLFTEQAKNHSEPGYIRNFTT